MADLDYQARRRPSAWLWLAGAAFLAAGVWLWSVWKADTKPREWPVARGSELTLKEGRFHTKPAGEVFTGWLTEVYPDGALRSRSFVSNGVMEGISEGWHTNGVKQVQESFVGGKSEGTVTKWSPEGFRLSMATTHEGQLDGIFRRWHTNGVLAEQMEMRQGVADGLARSWHPSGSPKAEVLLKMGNVVSSQYWRDGERAPEMAVAKAGTN